MVKVALTGAGGLVGSRIIELLQNKFLFIPLPQTDMDITNKESVQKIVNDTNFDVFLHLAAYTNVDAAEHSKETAMKINVDGTQNVFEAVKEKDKKFIYVSTDFVFDGVNPPYYEDSLPHPLSVYALSKYEGEKMVKDNAMIIRISYPYRKEFSEKRDFVRSVVALLKQNKQLAMVTDSSFVPTCIDDIAFALSYLIDNYSPDIFHIVGSQKLTPFDAGKLIAKNYRLNESLITPISFDEYFTGKAPRPQYSEIKSKKNNFYSMKSFEEGLQFITH